MAVLGKDAILSAADLATEKVEIPQWGGDVVVGELTAAERDELSVEWSRKGGDMRNYRAALLVRCCRDEEGNRLFDAGDVEKLSEKSTMAIERLFVVASRLNGLDGGDVEDVAGN